MTTVSPIERASPGFRRTSIALFAAGFSTFALMYCMQPLLPELATTFNVSAATSSLAISLTTGALSATLLLAGHVSERMDRKTIIVMSLAATSALTLACVSAPSWTALLVARVLAGIAFAGLPAIAMAYIAEEMAPSATGLAMGIYVAGTAVGGMSGRLLASMLTDAFGWRAAVGTTGFVGFGTAVLVAVLLPRARHLRVRGLNAAGVFAIYRRHLANRHLQRLFAQGFLYMGMFVAIYNYLTFRLVESPYHLGHAAIGSIFLLYLLGMVSSPLAGAIASTGGRRATLALSLGVMLVGTLVTLQASLVAIILGVGLLTFGFFAAHSVTSAWVGTRAGGHQAQASALYIVFYYTGASVAGTVAGLFWTRYGWNGVAGFVVLETLIALALVRWLPED